MTAEDDALESLTQSRLLEVLEWAAPVAFDRTRQDYDEDAGHDQMIIGVHNFVYLRDLLDRATANERFALPDGAASLGEDILGRGITPESRRSMPLLAPDRISRSDYQRSPGWAADGYRVLLQSFRYGEVDRIKWGQRSEAKRRVASQSFAQNVLFSDEDLGLETIAGIPDDDDFDGVTLVAAHSYDPITGRFELHIGQSKNPEFRGDSCWHWRRQLLDSETLPELTAQGLPLAFPGDAPSMQVEEINVRLKKARTGDDAATSNG
ncbi:hypothetical protein [Rathayibacter toxicus]|uniref:hypothetical protein n=1 Tax=Rathayibacter toxicus TaxID=145458 RepID=UPI000CE77108|nr:hypothetical protein [Rathayibacter toxicus]PPI56256.1 hypothetical protein C5D35_03320 [Rathayibacter toxicus]QOD09946.1 hypothetical protein BSG36_08415 [Rathayibacter toxicus]QWL28622.1 hypothetical protein E2R33_08450 [Rathayibacter toxicus]